MWEKKIKRKNKLGLYFASRFLTFSSFFSSFFTFFVYLWNRSRVIEGLTAYNNICTYIPMWLYFPRVYYSIKPFRTGTSRESSFSLSQFYYECILSSAIRDFPSIILVVVTSLLLTLAIYSKLVNLKSTVSTMKSDEIEISD